MHWMAKAFKPSGKGKLHRNLGVPQGKPIPPGKVEKAAHSSNSTIQHEAQAAINANPGRYRRG